MNSRFRTFLFALVSVALLYVPLMNGVEQSLGIDGSLVGGTTFEVFKISNIVALFLLGPLFVKMNNDFIVKVYLYAFLMFAVYWFSFGAYFDDPRLWGVRPETFCISKTSYALFRFTLDLLGLSIGIPFARWVKQRYDQPDILKLLRD